MTKMRSSSGKPRPNMISSSETPLLVLRRARSVATFRTLNDTSDQRHGYHAQGVVEAAAPVALGSTIASW